MANENRARDLMSRDPQCVTETQNIQQAAQMMRDNDIGALPVVQSENDRKVLGMVTDRDIVVRLIAQGRNPSDCVVRDAMTREVHAVHEEDSADDVLALMGREQIRRVPVVNQSNELVGIVAQADVATQMKSDRKVADTIENISEGRKTAR